MWKLLAQRIKENFIWLGVALNCEGHSNINEPFTKKIIKEENMPRVHTTFTNRWIQAQLRIA